MKIYINNNLINSEVLPTDAPTLDETLETFNFVLKASENPLPYAPMQPVRVELENDNNDVINLVLISDSVDTYSLKPQLYKHTISCVQNTRELSKHLVRNSVFSQPASKFKKSFNAESGELYRYTSDGTVFYTYANIYRIKNAASTPLNLDSKEKVKNAYLQIDFQCLQGGYRSSVSHTPAWINGVKSLDELTTAAPDMTLTMARTLTLSYKDANNNTYTQTITPSMFGSYTDFPLNQKLEFPLIIELASQGYKDFELLFPTDRVFLEITDVDLTSNTNIVLFMAQPRIVAETYYYTVYDILNLLLERQKQEDDNYYKQPLFSLPTRAENEQLYDLLTNTVAPNFTFTQLTMYECVAEVFRLFDAIFTMDSSGVLNIEYFNELNKTPLDSPKFSGRNLAISEEKYTNGLVAYYQDARLEESFPANNTFANVRSASLGVPTADDHYFIVPHPIHSVIEAKTTIFNCSLKLASIDTPVSFNPSNSLEIDFTDFLFDETLWMLLDTGEMSRSDYEDYIPKQVNTLNFTRGDNKINVAYTSKGSWGATLYSYGYMWKTILMKLCGVKAVSPYYLNPEDDITVNFTGQWKDIRMKLTYLATIDGRTQVESIVNKYPGETLVDQVNGAVDLNKMGLNMFGLSLKMGEPVLSATHQISKWEDRIKTGDIYSYQNSLWVANVCSYTFVGGYIQGKISFVKNFNSLALRTRLLREKRVSNISQELTMKSEDNYIEYVYYTTDTSDIEAESEQTIAYNNDLLYDGITMSFGKRVVDEYKISMATLNINSEIYYLPSIRYGSGNMICFEFAYSSPISAGNQTVYKTSSSWFGSNKYFTSAIKYTDDNGFLDTATIKMVSATDNLEFDSNFPVLTSFSTDLTDVMTLSNYKLYKQPNEIFALNYELAFIPYQKERDFIGSAFINDNFFVNGEFKEKKLYLYYSSTEKYDILDTEGIGTATEITNVVGTAGANYFTLVLQHENITDTILSWSICDENGKILFASNSSGGAAYTDRRRIFFLARHTRLS